MPTWFTSCHYTHAYMAYILPLRTCPHASIPVTRSFKTDSIHASALPGRHACEMQRHIRLREPPSF
eukprot:1141921-Pelagomonas_calceolata.AAC.2